ncbi:MFS transporter [Variovorax sp. PCZ-1]|uniref:MFS transporter n=1 Tax=Variovorax sp. PCZ-1 TaxID=2835533 RepID=UPI001BCE0C04|nr:MFS transporter [Variovorax sp. PCZ-1]MBS7807983.1 MFS transporter [Variovorax sp. PCZ-1]
MTTPLNSSTLSPRREFWLLLTLAGIQFTHILDFMIMMPLGPQLRQVFGISDTQFGLLVSAYTFSAGASGLAAAFYVDRFGRKKLLLILYSLFALATLACGLAPTYESLMAARVAAGVFGGVLSALSQTIVGDVIPQERRGQAMGVVMSAFSISTVAGVPLGLFLAAHFNWHVPFLAIAAFSGVLVILAWQTLPKMRDHLKAARKISPLTNLLDTVKNQDHQKALLFTFLMMFVGFVVIPYITLYTTSNGGLSISVLPYIYLCGGIATLLTARAIGRATDARGKVPMFRTLALLAIIPVLGLTISAPTGLYGIFAITTLFFVFMSGRMIPGMAIVTSACNPPQRGTFMALNSAAQSLGMSAAAFLGGLIISRDAQGLVLNYWASGLVGVAASLVSYWLVGKLRLDWNTPANPS